MTFGFGGFILRPLQRKCGSRKAEAKPKKGCLRIRQREGRKREARNEVRAGGGLPKDRQPQVIRGFFEKPNIGSHWRKIPKTRKPRLAVISIFAVVMPRCTNHAGGHYSG